MRVLVCGGRDFSDKKMLVHALDKFHVSIGISLLIQGGQRKWDKESRRWIGADWLASEWARWREIAFVTDPAKWTSEGKSAGPIRNSRMLDNWRPEFVIAFPGGNGTADMISQATKEGLRVQEVK